MISSRLRSSVLLLALSLLVGTTASDPPKKEREKDRGQTNAESKNLEERRAKAKVMKVQYLEIVTPSVKETCDALAKAHGVAFSEPIAEFGNARTAELTDGGRIGVRAPMRDTEKPVVRPYILVNDIEAAVKAAEATGAQVAMPPMEIPGGQGTFSIYILGGIEHGLWQL